MSTSPWTHDDVISSTSWRVRDAADNLLAQRGLRSTSRSDEDPENGGLNVSRYYDVDTSLVRLRRDKTPIVRAALDAAASAILENLHKLDDDDAEREDEFSMQSNRKLPAILEDIGVLQEMRVASMERAHANKDLSRRKIAVAKEQERERLRDEKEKGALQTKAASRSGGRKKKVDGAVPDVVASCDSELRGTKKHSGSMLSFAPSSTHVSSRKTSGLNVAGSSASPGAAKSTMEGAGESPSKTVKSETTPLSGVSRQSNASSPVTTAAPKFTRNTPASSASALEARLTGSRAILCTIANVTFDALTPPLPEWGAIDIADVPQNHNKTKTEDNAPSADKKALMDNIVLEAKKIGQRIHNIATNAAKRSRRRYRFRKDNRLFQSEKRRNNNSDNVRKLDAQEKESGFRIPRNPFAWKDDEDDESDFGGACAMQLDDDASIVTADNSIMSDNSECHTEAWSKICIPRLLSILQTGVGNAIIHDVMWSTRHGRIANLLQEISRLPKNDDHNDENGNSNQSHSDEYFGLHLIVTVNPDVDRFAKEFKSVNSHLRLMSTVSERSLRALPYKGNKERRRRLRKHFPEATGLPDAPFHVIITSYADFLTDYIHFCQTPFEVVIMDDGASWMAAAHNDPNSPIGTMWNDALFSKNDHQMGLAGSTLRDWDYGKDNVDEEVMKEAWVGLTARHRLVTSSKVRIENSRSPGDVLPVAGLLNFALPHFAEAVREEWDRSRISNDAISMGHFRKLLTRSLVVHDPTIDPEKESIFHMAMKTLQGDMPESIQANDDPMIPTEISDDRFIADGKVASSRRSALQWLGYMDESWLRYELGSVSFEPIISAMKLSLNYGHICEEISTASSVSTGATGQIIGNLAFKSAVRCGKCFGSEQGLRQHLSSHHAPPGTWLCRTCKADCVTSQARTHHERSCGQASSGNGAKNESSATTSSSASKKDTGKKKGKAAKGGSSGSKEGKNADGSARVPSTTGLGGGVVPLLAVINIKDLPADVKPLLRDPRQTSRTGGNSKRHVYAYRGVCRQARKGHDRWQSQISFLGVNHYLGTFDSEWDAAAIYAWAHLILYGEEATRKAQKEGEEAAAAYEQEKKDIAAGKIPVPPPKPDKKSKQAGKKKGDEKTAAKKGQKATVKKEDKAAANKKKTGRSKRKCEEETSPSQTPAKRSKSTGGKEDIAPILAKSVGKATTLTPIPKFADMSDDELAREAAIRMVAARSVNYCITEVQLAAPIHVDFRPCVPRMAGSYRQMGCALLVGLDPHLFSWNIDSIINKQYFGSDIERRNATGVLTAEFGKDGLNQQFRCLIQGSTTVIGCASSRMKRVYASLGMGTPAIGGPIGRIDCNTGGDSKCCSETAACIQYVPTDTSDFQVSALSSDLITMNGQRITPEMGNFPLFNEDICTIGSRVFLFLLPSDT
eukprot:CAMPEP_0172367978 /NCGR_PEP_ID=MMETSP1060-20121228/24846_1 /TAXON_ID=37318 /ORGANISM="Pseudo-nitzschia pungens, Strain cf. cingulata" /LENGTH=1417 /DNA_ID=CAMNT_0013092431 /DNA_START=159 /DNA_END=4412 /DNA_ORIENTATION=+